MWEMNQDRESIYTRWNVVLPSTRSIVDDILRWFFCPQTGSGSRWLKNDVKQWDMGHAKEVKHDSRFVNYF